MDINSRCCCLLVLLFCTIDVNVLGQYSPPVQPRKGNTETETHELPPEVFPKVPPQTQFENDDSEVPDLLKDPKPMPNPDTDTVDHPNVKDDGKTHEEGGIVPKVGTQNDTLKNDTTLESKTNVTPTLNVTGSNSTKEGSSSVQRTSGIYTCNFPKSWLKQVGNNSGVDDWRENSENDTNICSFPPEGLSEISNDALHICTIHKEWLRDNNYTIQNGTIPKELLSETNTSNISCVTPKDAFQDDNNDTSHYNTIPRAWLREGNDIYIYLVPEDVLDTSENATEAESEEPTTIANISVIPKKLENSTEVLNVTSTVSESNSTSAASPKNVSRANITSEVTTVKVLTNETNNSTVTESVTDITAETAPQEATVAPVPEVVKSNITETSPTRDSNKTSADDLDKNRTIQGKDNDTQSTPDVVENIIRGKEGTTPSSPAALLQSHVDHDHSSSSGKTAFLQPTESAAILAGVFVGIALLGYVGLLVWRRLLERRYGNREMLVNEEDDFDTSDMRHFESGLEDCKL